MAHFCNSSVTWTSPFTSLSLHFHTFNVSGMILPVRGIKGVP